MDFIIKDKCSTMEGKVPFNLEIVEKKYSLDFLFYSFFQLMKKNDKFPMKF